MIEDSVVSKKRLRCLFERHCVVFAMARAHSHVIRTKDVFAMPVAYSYVIPTKNVLAMTHGS